MMSIGKLGDVCVVIDAEGTDEADALAAVEQFFAG